MATDAEESTQNCRDVSAEDASIGVNLVDDDVAQVREEVGPLRMIGQNRRVKHVWIRQDQIRFVANAATLGGRRVTVVHARAYRRSKFVAIAN